MSEVSEALNSQPKGNFVNEDRVSKFSENLEEGEKAHFAVALNWVKIDGEKKNPTRQSLALFTDRRVLVLVKKVVGSNEKKAINYDSISNVEVETGVTSKKIIITCKDQEIILKATQPGKTECKDAVRFVNNVLEGRELDKGLSESLKSVGDYSPIGDYVNNERIAKVESVLDEGENVHYITDGGTVDVEGSQAGSSLFGNNRGRKQGTKGYVRAAFTQKRVVIKIPQWLGSDERTVPYRNITSVDLDTGLVNKRITLQTPGQTYHIEAQNPGKEECRKIIKFVRDKIRDSQTPDDSGSSEEDPLDRLEKLKSLHEDGVVSDEEFEEKKQDLMDQI